ncbi:saccharopine dehydrogenase-like oxidoreductase [Onthophagus taurus]|uniref:saccharopine dehydrogenase-like oxidoreductase n=1 Tax=Onthophagus taurus TaxID=166361 RepID=UPI000C1FFC38|nr:saccharopine dehydrogenase-like oxidoreductase [Onthophagus taurus]
MANRLDIVIFGVTGFTGLRTIPYITNIIKQHNLSLTWGVAGRSETKIKRMLKELGQRNGVNYDNIPIIIADVNDENSLIKMTSQARIIINACGPYILYGEQVVKACIETGTHHVDVSGESIFIEKMQLLYHEEAKAKGIYIVSACGMDSIPAEMGIVYLKNNFEGTLNSVETYMYSSITDLHLGGPAVNTGTYNSIIYMLSNFFKTHSQRKLLFKTKLPSMQPKLNMKIIHKSDVINRWCLPLPEPDLAVIKRSQHLNYDLYNERPIQVNCYSGFGSVFFMILAMIYGFWLAMFSQFSFTRNLLLKYPRFFSYGIFSPEGPSEERQEATIFNLKLHGKGWSEKLKDPLLQPDSPPNKEIIAKVSGKNPGYGLTCAAFALSAIMILTEADKMPEKGGVYPPGIAFAKTSIIEKLQENGVKFELLSKN